MRPRRSAKSFTAACHCANTYAPSDHRLPRQFTHLMIPCPGFLKFRFLPTYSVKGSLVVAGSHERKPNCEGRLVLAAAFRLPFKPQLRDIRIRNCEDRRVMAIPHCRNESSGLIARPTGASTWGFIPMSGKSNVMEAHR